MHSSMIFDLDKNDQISAKQLKYITEALGLVYCEDIPNNQIYDFKGLKSKVGILLVLMSVLGALVGSIQTAFMRGFTISLGSSNLGLAAATTYIYFAIAVTLAVLQLKCINQGIELHKQNQVIPIYETSLIMLNILCGAIILNERKYYENTELLRLVGSGVICILGVLLIAKKPKLFKNDDQYHKGEPEEDQGLLTTNNTNDINVCYKN